MVVAGSIDTLDRRTRQMKKFAAVMITLAVTALMVVPAFAGPAEDIASAQATQDARRARLVTDQQNLSNFQSGQVAKGETEKAAGQEAAAAGQAATASFQSSQLEKSSAENAERQSALGKAQEVINSFWSSQKDAENAKNAENADVLKKINAYLASL